MATDSPDGLEKKRAHEKKILGQMLEIYCRGQGHGPGPGLCPACQELLSYAHRRIEACPRMEEKTYCSQCPTPCYGPKQRQEIQKIMRYAGPRMVFYHPGLLLDHIYQGLRQKFGR